MHISMEIWNAIFVVASVITLVACPVFVVNWFRYMKIARALPPAEKWANFPVKSVAFFMIPILVTDVVALILTSSARMQVLDQLHALSGNYEVYVEGHTYRESEKIISMIKQVSPYLAHHSHPTKMIRITIRGPQATIALELGRDSGRPQEYWVFYPGNVVTSRNEIGRVTTSLLDQY
jgi:hypothetical protein